MMVAMLHSTGQLKTERDGDTEKGCQKPAAQQKTSDDEVMAFQCSALSRYVQAWTMDTPICKSNSGCCILLGSNCKSNPSLLAVS